MNYAELKLVGDGSARTTSATVVTPDGKEYPLRGVTGFSLSSSVGHDDPGSVSVRLVLRHVTIDLRGGEFL